MRFDSVFLLASVALSSASPTLNRANHVVHEKRDGTPHGWFKREAVKDNTVLPMRFGLKQRNLDRGWEFLDSVSNPQSDRYAQHWTAKKVVDMFAPSEESISSVKQWLVDSGIAPTRISLSSSKSWIHVNATVAEAESLLGTKYHIYQHSSGPSHIACESYSLPAHLSTEHIDIILPSVHLDAKISAREAESRSSLRKRQGPQSSSTPIGKNGNNLPKVGATISPENIITQLENCDQMVTPDCLRALYGLPPNFDAVPGNSYGIVEFSPVVYLPEDMDIFFGRFNPAQVGQRPILDSIDGGNLQSPNPPGFNYQSEADLDLQYAMALVYPQDVTMYQTGDYVEGASLNNFLDGIDGSYCTYEGGDNPTDDAIYPDKTPGGYDGPPTCGAFAPANVISTSYGYDEGSLSPAYMERQCNEYMKLGLQGVTFLYSSGDNGVAGNSGCLNPNSSFGGSFSPTFPGTCPYVTSVGATQIPNNTNIVDFLATLTQPEVACETAIYSGGGFSNVFGMPSYQKSAVKDYLAKYAPSYGPGVYNTSGTSRGFPDVSANGANYVVAVDGNFSLVYGTSASTPTFGSVVTIINEALLAEGKKPVGFINPVLYANPWAMNDVTSGSNPGCGTDGFPASPGWDPVTGLGTPNYERLLVLFSALQLGL